MHGAKVDRPVRTGLVPAIVWGSEIAGMPPTQLLRARRIARSACRKSAAGRSLDLALALLPHGTDPADRSMGASLLLWKAALTEQWAPALWQHCAMQRAVATIKADDESDDWQSVVGPAWGCCGKWSTTGMDLHVCQRIRHPPWQAYVEHHHHGRA